MSRLNSTLSLTGCIAHNADEQLIIGEVCEFRIEGEHPHSQQIHQVACECVDDDWSASEPFQRALDVRRDKVVQVLNVASLSLAVAAGGANPLSAGMHVKLRARRMWDSQKRKGPYAGSRPSAIAVCPVLLAISRSALTGCTASPCR